MTGGMGAGQALGVQGARRARRRAQAGAELGTGVRHGQARCRRGRAERAAGAAGGTQACTASAAIRPCWPATRPGGPTTTRPDRPRHGQAARPGRTGWANWVLVHLAWFSTWFFDSVFFFLSH